MVTEIRVRESWCTWIGEVTWRHTAMLRELLLDLIEAGGPGPVFLDVTAVERIDRTGVALLVGCNHRAAAMDRSLVLIDGSGLTSAALSAACVRSSFAIHRSMPHATASAGSTSLTPQ